MAHQLLRTNLHQFDFVGLAVVVADVVVAAVVVGAVVAVVAVVAVLGLCQCL